MSIGHFSLVQNVRGHFPLADILHFYSITVAGRDIKDKILLSNRTALLEKLLSDRQNEWSDIIMIILNYRLHRNIQQEIPRT